MSKKVIIWLALLSLILLIVLCVCNKKEKIQNDIKNRSLVAISNKSGYEGDIIVNGRDVTINGIVNSVKLKLKLEQIIGSEEGVRKVINKLVVELPKGLSAETIRIIQEKLNKVIEFENIEFESNTALVLPKSESILQNAATIIENNPEISVEIGGHTDSTGNEDYNISLSQRRAEAVLMQLVKRGISRSRLLAKGYGSSQSIADNSTVDGQQQNRRVEFKILEEK